MPSYGVALCPVVEHVAELLASSSPYDVPVPTVLSGSKHKVAARKRAGVAATAKGDVPAGKGPNPGNLAPRGRRKARPPASPLLPLRTCRGCGGQLPIADDRERPRIDWCPECLPSRRREVGAALTAGSLEHACEHKSRTGSRPTHTRDAKARRQAANASQRAQQREWEVSHKGQAFDPDWFKANVLPYLATISLPAIANATGMSTTAAGKVRSGDRVPHPRHWGALAELIGSPGRQGSPTTT